jgi:hypothetical protein
MELTFENWKKGAIELSHTYKNNLPEIKTKEYAKFEKINFSKEIFTKEELLKIKKLQKDYFFELSKKLFDKLYDDYRIREESSDYPIRVLETELSQLNHILKGKWSKDILGLYTNRHADINMLENNYLIFKKYIERTKIRGFEPIYDFMPSPNSKYYSDEIFVIPEVYADVLFNFKTKLSAKHSNPDKISTLPIDLFEEPENEHPDIFTNGWAYEAFKIMEETVAVRERTYHADYALIYHYLHYPEIQAININVDKLTFANFINPRLVDKTIEVNKMKPATGIDKNMTIRYGIKYYLKHTNFKGNEEKLLNKIKP